MKRLVVGILVLISIFGEPLFWNSEASAQDQIDLRLNVREIDHSAVEKVLTLRFFEYTHDSVKVPVRKTEGAFTSPRFGSDLLPAESVGPRMVRAAATSGHAPIRLTVLALAQGDSASASSQSTKPTSGGSNPAVKKKSSKWIWIAVAAGGGAAAAAFAMKKSPGESGSNTSGGNTTTVTLGQPTVGAPQ